jgi:hypothetical protein
VFYIAFACQPYINLGSHGSLHSSFHLVKGKI